MRPSEDSKYYRVATDIGRAPLRDHLFHGYENRDDFAEALRRLVELWGERVGECIDSRRNFVRLRFWDTPGGRPDEAWLPLYLVKEDEAPAYLFEKEDPVEKVIDEVMGFR